jgi:DNA mismatch repair protein MSH6
VTFLYTLAEGVCPNSYGINVARLARLPDSLVRKAARMSKQLAGVHAAAAAASSEVGVLEGIEAELRLVVERSDNAALTSLWRRARAALAAK